MKRALKRLFTAVVLLWGLASGLGNSSWAQSADGSGGSPADSQAAEIAKLKELIFQLNDKNNAIKAWIPSVSQQIPAAAATPEYNKQYWNYYSERFGRLSVYDKSLMDHVDRVLTWQEWASNAVLYLMLFIAVSGVAFSGFQLYVASRRGFELIQSNMTVEAGKFQLNTSVIGLIILFVSMFYLYLFLKEVYAIRPLDFGGALSAAQSEQAAVVPPNPQATK